MSEAVHSRPEGPGQGGGTSVWALNEELRMRGDLDGGREQCGQAARNKQGGGAGVYPWVSVGMLGDKWPRLLSDSDAQGCLMLPLSLSLTGQQEGAVWQSQPWGVMLPWKSHCRCCPQYVGHSKLPGTRIQQDGVEGLQVPVRRESRTAFMATSKCRENNGEQIKDTKITHTQRCI